VPEAPLFGKGLYLDFIDALESVLAISKIHGLQLRSEDKANPRIFASLHALSAHILQAVSEWRRYEIHLSAGLCGSRWGNRQLGEPAAAPETTQCLGTVL
jgi:hypothetical protein